jgi:hypothetical protein
MLNEGADGVRRMIWLEPSTRSTRTQNIGQSGRKAGDADRAATQAAGALDAPTLGVGVRGEGAPGLCQVRAALGQLHIKSQAQVFSLSRHFPHDVIGVTFHMM